MSVVLSALSLPVPARMTVSSIHALHPLTLPSFRDRFGRRIGMFMGGLIICTGTAVIATSTQVGQFIAGRFILGFGISFMTCAAPSYVIEIAPPQWRGKFTAFYNCGSAPSTDPWIINVALYQVVGLVAPSPRLLSSSGLRGSKAIGRGGSP